MTESAPTSGNTSSHQHNRDAWDKMAKNKQRFTRPAKDEDFRDPLNLVDRWGWLGGEITGKKVLCLGAGGGRQGPLYAAAGGIVTVVDISAAQLEVDREVASERNLDIKTVETSMEDLSMFAPADFDIVIHPVSTCYVPEIAPVYLSVARVLCEGGIYISQHKTPTSLQADIKRSPGGYELLEPYYREDPLPAVVGSRHREEGTHEYLHRWEEIVGHMCRAGFVIEDLVEPLHAEQDAEVNSFADRSKYVAPYVRIKARRKGQQQQQVSASGLWLPGG